MNFYIANCFISHIAYMMAEVDMQNATLTP